MERERLYQGEGMQRLANIRETIFRLDRTLESVARAYRNVGEGLERGDITIPALKIVAGLSAGAEEITGEKVIAPETLNSLEPHQNLDFASAEVRTKLLKQFNMLFTLRQRAKVNLADLYRRFILEQVESMGSSAGEACQVSDSLVYQDQISSDLINLLPSNTRTRFDAIHDNLTAVFTEVEDAIKALTLSDFTDYFNELCARAAAAVSGVSGAFSLPKLNLEQMVGIKTQWETPHAIGSFCLRTDDDEGGTLTTSFSPSDGHPEVKCGHVNATNIHDMYCSFLEIQKRIAVEINGCSLISEGACLGQLKEMANKSVMTPDEYVMFIYGESLETQDVFEKSSSYIGQLIATEAVFDYMYSVARLVQIVRFASPIIMNYCVTLNR